MKQSIVLSITENRVENRGGSGESGMCKKSARIMVTIIVGAYRGCCTLWQKVKFQDLHNLSLLRSKRIQFMTSHEISSEYAVRSAV